MNLLLDTNVLIDFIGRRAPFYEDAKHVIAAGYFGDAHLWMAAQSAMDVFLCFV
jgi:predicted nucleic acid-binding protein